MSGDDSDGDPPRSVTPRDDEYIEGYAKGYGDGLREALRELRAHAARGASPQELRMLIASRLARIPEDVEVRRKGLLSPPIRAAWSSLLRPPAAPTWSPPKATLPAAALAAGTSVLVREDRPDRALALLRASATTFRRVFLVSQRPPALEGVAAENIEAIEPAPFRSAGSTTAPGLDPSVFAGRIRESVDVGGTLTYLDAIEFLASEYGPEFTVRVVSWVATEATRNGSAVLATISPRALEPRDLSRLERTFQSVR